MVKNIPIDSVSKQVLFAFGNITEVGNLTAIPFDVKLAPLS